MISITHILHFGTGTLCIGCAKVEDFWYVSIRPVKEAKAVGEKLTKDDVDDNGIETYLTFPSEEQMLKVYAALGQKTYEVVKEKWDAAFQAKELVMTWEEIKNV